MEDSSRPSSPSFFARIARNPLAWIGAVVIVVPVLFFAALPFGAKYYLQKWLLENGAEVAVIEKIRFNPFTGTVSLIGADIRKDGEVVYADSTITLDLGLGALFSKEVLLERAVISDLVVDIERFADGGMRFGSYTVTGMGLEKVEEPVEESTPSPWAFHAAEIDISNLTLRYRQPDLNLDLHVTEGSITGVNTSPESEKGSVRLIGTLNKAPFVLELDRVGILPELTVEGKVNLGKLDLGMLADILEQQVKPFTGVAGVDGALSFRMGSGEMESVFDGGLTLQKIAAGGKGWSSAVGIDWKGKVHYAMTSGEMVVESDGSLSLTAPSVALDLQEGKKLTFSNGKTTYTGKAKYAAGGAEEGDGALDLNGLLSLSKTGLDIPDSLSFDQQKLDLKGKVNVGLGKKLKVRYRGDLALQDTAVALKEGLQAAGKTVSWKGEAGFLSDGKKQEVTLKGNLDGADLAVTEPKANIHVAQASLGLKSSLVLALADTPVIKGKIGVVGKGIRVDQGETTLVRLEQLDIVDGQGDAQGKLRVEGVNLSSLSVPPSSVVPLAVKIPTTRLKGITFPEYSGLNLDELEVNGLEIVDPDKGQRPAKIGSLIVNDLVADRNGSVTAGGLGVAEGAFLQDAKEEAKPLVTLGGLKTSPFSWSKEGGLVCDKVVLDSLFSEVTRQKTTKQTEEKTPEPKEGVTEKTEGEEEAKSTGLPVKIGLIELTGDSGFAFIDKSLKRPFSTKLLFEVGRIENIDLNQPEQPISYSLKGMFDGYSPLVISGKTAPLARKILVEQKTNLTNYSLQPVSPYAVEAIGTYFESGRLDLNSEMTITGDTLKIGNDLLIKDIKTKTVNSELAAELSNKLPVPLDMALSMMEDSKGNIELSIPLSGTFADLKVGFSDVLLIAVSKAITVGVTPYLAYTALGPTGALVFLGAKLGQSLLTTELTPLEFEKGVVDISEEQKTLLQKTGESIAKDPEGTYSICAKVCLSELGEGANGQDAYSVMGDENSRKKLFELGDARSQAIKLYLLENFSIPEERLLICNPGVEYRAGARSVVEFKQ